MRELQFHTNKKVVAILYAFLGIVTVLWLFPVIWMFITSVKTQVQTFQIPPVWIFKPTYENYSDLFFASSIQKYLVNSLVISSVSTGGSPERRVLPVKVLLLLERLTLGVL